LLADFFMWLRQEHSGLQLSYSGGARSLPTTGRHRGDRSLDSLHWLSGGVPSGFELFIALIVMDRGHPGHTIRPPAIQAADPERRLKVCVHRQPDNEFMLAVCASAWLNGGESGGALTG
jgi:hypothetical protein